MSDGTSIEWTDATWNPVRGCKKVSPGCKHCYAETFAERFRGVPGHPYERGFDPRLVPDKLGEPLHWRKPRTVFANSMSDLFFEDFPHDYIAACFGVMAACPQHTFQVLTKRPKSAIRFFSWVAKREDMGRAIFPDDEPSWRVGQMLAATLRKIAGIEGYRSGTRATKYEDFDPRRQPWPLPNVWLGVSVEDRKYGLPRIDALRELPAAVRFLSIEPLLEDLGDINLDGIHWVIVGGESGLGARPMQAEWVRSLRDQCAAAGVAFFFKQWGGVRKKVAGRLLDGVTHDAMPEVRR